MADQPYGLLAEFDSQHAPPESVAVLVDAVHALSAPYHGAGT